MARTHIVIPSGGRVDSDYLEALSDEMADMVVPKTTPLRLKD